MFFYVSQEKSVCIHDSHLNFYKFKLKNRKGKIKKYVEICNVLKSSFFKILVSFNSNNIMGRNEFGIGVEIVFFFVFSSKLCLNVKHYALLYIIYIKFLM